MQIFGFNLLKFKPFIDKLDKLNGKGAFKGFTPRWILPVTIRNNTDSYYNTSALMVIIDSARELDLGFINFFSQ